MNIFPGNMRFGAGQPVKRLEDQRLLTGKGLFIDDKPEDGALWLYVLRSPHAHAKIVSIDTKAAAGMPGVEAVYAGADLIADNIGTLPTLSVFKRPDGSPMTVPPRRLLAHEIVRFAGEPIAAVVAATSVAISVVRSSLRTARVAVLLAVHDSRNLVRKALGRPALPPPDFSIPARKRRRPAQRKSAHSHPPSESDEPLWLARTAPEGGGHVPNPAARTGRRGWAWAGFIAIVVTLVVVLMGSMRGGNPPVASHVIAPPQNVTSSCPLLLPGGPTSTNGEVACGTLSVQHPDVVLVCDQLSQLSAPWNFVGRNATTGNIQKGPSLTLVGNSCRLESPPEQQAEISTALSAGDVVLIVDFVLTGHGNFEVGLAARCSSNECVNVEADTSGSVWMAERSGNTWTNRATGTHEPFPADVNRLVMWVGANTEMGWLNGKVIDSVSVKTGTPAGDASFFISTADNYNPAPVVVDVRQFVITGLH